MAKELVGGNLRGCEVWYETVDDADCSECLVEIAARDVHLPTTCTRICTQCIPDFQDLLQELIAFIDPAKEYTFGEIRPEPDFEGVKPPKVRKCLKCRKVPPMEGGAVCDECDQKIRSSQKRRCGSCGAMTRLLNSKECLDCILAERLYEKAVGRQKDEFQHQGLCRVCGRRPAIGEDVVSRCQKDFPNMVASAIAGRGGGAEAADAVWRVWSTRCLPCLNTLEVQEAVRRRRFEETGKNKGRDRWTDIRDRLGW